MPQSQTTKRVTVDGKTYTVPFDATLDEIDELLGGGTNTPTPIPQTEQKSFWDSTFGRFLGPAADSFAAIPGDLFNTASTIAEGVRSNPSGFMRGTLLAMTNPAAFASTPTGQALGQGVVDMFTEDVQQGGEKLRQGDWAGGMGEALDGALKIGTAGLGGPAMRGLASATRLDRIPNAVYRAGLRVQGPTARQFGDASTLAARGLDEGITGFDQAQSALRRTEGELQGLVGGMNQHTTPVMDILSPAYDDTFKQGKIADRLGRTPELTKELDKLQSNTFRDAPLSFTAQDLLNGKRGSSMEANYSRNAMGDLTTSDIHELWYNNLANQQKSGLDRLATQHNSQTMPSSLLKQEQELMGIMDAIGRRTGQGSHFGDASLAAGFGNAIGGGAPGKSLLKAGLTATVANALTSPSVMLPSAVGLSRAGRAVSSTPAVGGTALINAILRQYEQQQQQQRGR